MVFCRRFSALHWYVPHPQRILLIACDGSIFFTSAIIAIVGVGTNLSPLLKMLTSCSVKSRSERLTTVLWLFILGLTSILRLPLCLRLRCFNNNYNNNKWVAYRQVYLV